MSAAPLLSVGLGYLLLALVARWLPPEANAAFLASWGLLFGLGGILTAVEQEITRRSTLARLENRRVGLAVVQMAGVAVLVSVSALAVLALVPATRPVFHDSAWVGALVAAAIVGFGIEFLCRGILLGSGAIGRYVAVVVLEAALRLGGLAAVMVSGVAATLDWALAAVACGSLCWLPFLPRVLRLIDWRGGRVGHRSASAVVAALALSNGLAALVLTAFPTLVVSIVGSSAGLATLFAAVTLARLPLIALTPLQTLAVPAVTRLVHAGRQHDITRLVGRVGLLTTAAAAVVAGVTYLIGPWVLRVFMGARYEASAGMLVVLLVSACYLGAGLLQVAALVALQRYAAVVLTWVLTDAVAVAAIGGFGGEAAARGMRGLVCASLTAFVVSAVLVRRAAGGGPAGVR